MNEKNELFPPLFNKLSTVVEKIAVQKPDDIEQLLKSYKHVRDYLLAHDDLTAKEYEHVVSLFEHSIAKNLFSAGAYDALFNIENNEFKNLRDILKKKCELGKSALKNLYKIQLDYANRIRSADKVEQKEFRQLNDLLSHSLDSDYESENYFRTLSQRIHLLLAGYKNADLLERYEQICQALNLCSEALQFLKTENNKAIENYFEQLIDICFAYYFAIHVDKTWSPQRICLLAFNFKNIQPIIDLLARLQNSADLILSHAVLMANDNTYGRHDFICLALERSEKLYELIVDHMKNNFDLPKQVSKAAVDCALEYSLAIGYCDNQRDRIKAISVKKADSLLAWRKNKADLKSYRDQAEIRLKNEPIGNAHQTIEEFNTKLQSFIGNLFDHCVLFSSKNLPFEYVLLGLGSLARNEACPFSDLECAFLLEDKALLVQHKEHTKMVLHLFKLCIIALGETPFLNNSAISAGFRLDDADFHPLNKEINLCGTVKEMAAHAYMEHGILCTASLVASSANGDKLYKDFQNAITDKLSQPGINAILLKDTLYKEIVDFNANNLSLKPFSPDQIQIPSVKENFLRPLVFLLSALNLSLELGELSSLKRLEKLQSLGKINSAVAEMIKHYFAFALRLRFLAHFHKGSEEGEILYLKPQEDDQNPFCINIDENAYKILMSFRDSIMILLSDCFKNPDIFASKVPQQYPLVIPALTLMADEYFTRKEWEAAFSYYQLVLSICPPISEYEAVILDALQTQIRDLLIDDLPELIKESMRIYLTSNEDEKKIPWHLVHQEWSKFQSSMPFPLWEITLPTSINQGFRLLSMASVYLCDQNILWDALKTLYLQLPLEEYQKKFISELYYWHMPRNHNFHSSTFQVNILLRFYYSKLPNNAETHFDNIFKIAANHKMLAADLSLFLQKEFSALDLLSNEQEVKDQKTILTLLKNALKYEFTKIKTGSRCVDINTLIRNYYIGVLARLNANEEYEKLFINITLYLLYSKSSLDIHRHYYRLLPKEQYETCRNAAKEYFRSYHNTEYFISENENPVFWAKLWDTPLSNGDRSSHQEIKQSWESILNNAFKAKGESQIINPVKINGIISGRFTLDSEITKELIQKEWISSSGKFTQKEEHPIASKMPGNHLVIPWPLPSQKKVDAILNLRNKALKDINKDLLKLIQSEAKFYFKIYPEYPLMELFLNDLTYRLGYYPPREVDLWLWEYEGLTYPILVSEAVPGNSLQTLLENYIPLELNPQAFSQSMVISALTCQGDNKPDNSIVYNNSIEGNRICLIDADRWFVPAFEDNALEVKDIVFCLDNMKSVVDPVFIEEFLSLNPQELLQAWAKQMKNWGWKCIDIFGEQKIEEYFGGWLRKDTRKTLLLPPLKFNTIFRLFHQIQALQEVLSSSSPYTGYHSVKHFALLSKINSRLANHYLLSHEKKINIFDRFTYLTEHGYIRGKGNQLEYFTSKVDFKTKINMWDDMNIQNNWKSDIATINIELEKSMESIDTINRAKQELKNRNVLPFKMLSQMGKKKVLDELDWSELKLSIQRFFLTFLTMQENLENYLHLTINNSEEINDEDMQILLRKSSMLKRLLLNNCPKLSDSIWTALPEKDCSLNEIILKHLSNMKSLSYRGYALYREKYLTVPNLQILSIVGCTQIEEINIKAEELKTLILRDSPHQYHPKLKIISTQSQKLDMILANDYINYQKLLFPIINTLKKINEDKEFNDKKNIEHLNMPITNIHNDLNNQENSNPDSIATLKDELANSDPEKRAKAAAILIKLGHEIPEAIRVLTIMIKSKALYASARIWAAAGLGNVKNVSSEIITVLNQALDDPDNYTVRLQAAASLEKIVRILKEQIEQIFNSIEEESNVLLPNQGNEKIILDVYESNGFFRQLKKEIPDSNLQNNVEVLALSESNPTKSTAMHSS
jgi:hypothetical protein